MNKRTIDTVCEDIEELFTANHPDVLDERALQTCVDDIKNSIREAIETSGKSRPFVLRASNLGTADRKLWLQSRDPNYGIHDAGSHMTFLMGHILEALMVYLTREAGHTVTEAQKEIERFGVKGHIDGRIDGVKTDYKSASSNNYKKFSTGSLRTDDPYGYLYQMAFYTEEGDEDVAWFAIDKQYGKYCLLFMKGLELPNVESRIEHLREMLSKEEMPEEICAPEKEHENGNVELPNACGWCEYRGTCWPNARAFKYANGIRRFSKVVKEPTGKVKEVTSNG